MAEPLRLLVFSKDPSLFHRGGQVQGDTQDRHVRYAQTLRQALGDTAEIRIIGPTRGRAGRVVLELCPGLALYGTGSLHRATYLFDVARLAAKMIGDGWKPTAISVQTPWEEGWLGALLAARLKARFLPQIHFDLFAKEWRREHVLNRWRAFVADKVLRRASRVRVVAEPLRRRVSAELGIGLDRIDTIPVGVNFQPSALTPEQAKAVIDPRLAGHPVVLFVGRLVAAKNLDLWLEVAADVLAKKPGARFLVAGDGEAAASARQKASSLGLGESVLFLGGVGYERLPDLFRAADVFLLTSSNEGFGRVIIEAGLSGVPSVATRCSGPEYIIEHGRTGLLADKTDREDLARHVMNLLDNDLARRAMGDAARHIASDKFSLDTLAAMLIAHWTAP